MVVFALYLTVFLLGMLAKGRFRWGPEVRFYLPWRNLGCLGLRVGSGFYADVFLRPYFGLYAQAGNSRRRLGFFPPRVVMHEYYTEGAYHRYIPRTKTYRTYRTA